MICLNKVFPHPNSRHGTKWPTGILLISPAQLCEPLEVIICALHFSQHSAVRSQAQNPPLRARARICSRPHFLDCVPSGMVSVSASWKWEEAWANKRRETNLFIPKRLQQMYIMYQLCIYFKCICIKINLAFDPIFHELFKVSLHEENKFDLRYILNVKEDQRKHQNAKIIFPFLSLWKCLLSLQLKMNRDNINSILIVSCK